jgi:flagellin-like hook-associated protein FlgL
VNTALGNKANVSDIEDFFDDAKYEDSGTSKVINFYHGNTIKSTINADDFIKDGMISGVTLETKSGTTYIVINWNTDAGIQTTELDIGDVFDADNYYQKSETSGKTEISTASTGKSDTGHTHSQYLTGITSSQVTTALGYTPADNNHTHVASGITAMTGYEIASSGSSIATTDTLNQAIGKLEKMIDELKQFISDKEMTIAAALTDLDDRLKAIE